MVRPDGDYVQGGNPAQEGMVDSELSEGGDAEADGSDAMPEEEGTELEDAEDSLSDIDKIVNDVLGETGLTENELVELVEEEVPLVSDPAMAVNAKDDGPRKGWMLGLFFLLLLLIAVLFFT